MAYTATITRLVNVRPHTNADRVLLATCLGNQVVVGLNSQEGDLGIYFPSDGQLSNEFCTANSLYREASLNRDKDQTGMFDTNRRVRAQKFRGEISDGFWLPLDCLKFISSDIKSLCEGDEFVEFKGTPVCNKYVNQATLRAASQTQGKKAKKAKTSVMFKEHFDTEHFGKNVFKFEDIDHRIVITEKLHGTSGRIGFVQVDRTPALIEKIASFFGAKIQKHEWKYLNGTRRVVIEESSGSQFHDPTIRDKASKLFEGKLRKGETVFFEIVGYEPSGQPIMPKVSTKGLNDKAFTKKYGEDFVYAYGNAPRESSVFVYRISMTNEDGQSYDLSWEDVKTRCTEMNVSYVPELNSFALGQLQGDSSGRDLQDLLVKIVEDVAKGPSVLDETHIREGVCVRIDQFGFAPKVFKHKSFEFKVLEGIIKDAGIVDEEEAQG
jgi:hypothetical protein